MGYLKLKADDPAVLRVVKMLDAIPKLPGFEMVLAGMPVTHQRALHLAVLVDSLLCGDYTPDWRGHIVSAFIAFREEVAEARQRHRTAHETSPCYERFVALLGGSGSDTTDVIRRRHAFFLERMYPAIKVVPRDGKRAFDALDKEWIWIRDKGVCQCCRVPATFADATVHHVIEHAAGGPTTGANGILVCSLCHSDRRKMQELTPQFVEYLRQVGQRPEPTLLRITQDQVSRPPGPVRRRTNPTIEIRIGTEAINVARSNQIPVEVANWILRQGRTLPIIPNVLHETASGFPLASQPKPLNNGWFIEVGDSQEVLIQRARRLLNECEFRDVPLEVVLKDGTIRSG